MALPEALVRLGFKDDTKEGARGAKASLKNLKKDADNTIKALAAVGAAAAAISVKIAATFEKKMAEVSTLLEDTSSLDLYTQAVNDMAVEFGKAPVEQAQALYNIISGGADTAAKAIGILDAANRLATGGIAEVDTAAKALVSVMGAYGEAVGSASDISDTLFVGMRAGQTTITELSESVGLASSLAAKTGVSFQELVAATSAITTGGINTARAVKGLQQVMISVIGPTTEAEEAIAEITKTNKDFDFSIKALDEKGLVGFMDMVKEATGGNVEIMQKLFTNVQALGPALALTGEQGKAFEKIMRQMDLRTGETAKAFEKMSKTSAEKMAQVKAQTTVLAQTLGNHLLPMVADVADIMLQSSTEGGLSVFENTLFKIKVATYALLDGMANLVEKAILLGVVGLRIIPPEALAAVVQFRAAMEASADATLAARDAAEKNKITLRDQVDLILANADVAGVAATSIEDFRGATEGAAAAVEELGFATQSFSSQASAAEAVIDSISTAHERWVREVARLQDLMDEGFLTEEQYAKAAEVARENIFKIKEAVDESQKAMERFKDSAVDALVDVAFEGRDLESVFKSLLKQLISMAIQGELFKNVLGSGGGSGGGLSSFLSTAFSAAKSFLGFAEGGIVQGGLRPLASGGVVNKPTMAMIGEGGRNEAVVPLPDGKSIPVIGGGGGDHFEININAPGADKGSEARLLEIVEVKLVPSIIRRASDATLGAIKRPRFS